MKRIWILAALLIATGLGHAGETRYWELGRQADFQNGKKLKGVVVEAGGRIRVGADTDLVALPGEPSAWSGVVLPDGEMILGSGRGRIYSLKEDEVREVFDTGEMLVTDIVRSGDLLYAATLPKGRIFRRNANGDWAEWAKLEMKEIWALAASDAGTVYAVGGPKAAVYKVDPDGKASPLYEGQQERALCVNLVAEDHLLVGTVAPGQVIRLEGSDATVVYDFGENEVKSIVRKGKRIFAAINSKTGALPHQLLKAWAPRPPKKAEKPPKKEEEEDYYMIVPDLDAISGKWKGEIEVNGDKQEFNMELENAEGTVTGTARTLGAMQEALFKLQGTWDEKEKALSLDGKAVLKIGQRELELGITLKGKLVAEDSLEGLFTLFASFSGETFEGKFTASRVEKPAVPEKPAQEEKPEKEGTPTPAEPAPRGPRAPRAPAPPIRAKPLSSVWMISPARTERLRSFAMYIPALAWWKGSLLVGSNQDGRVYRLFQDRRAEILLAFDRGNVLGFNVEGDTIHAVRLGDAGAVGRVLDQPASRPVYESAVLDTRFLSRWGKIAVRASGAIELRTRTAVMAKEDEGLSEWSEPIKKFPAQITSPRGRFIQFRILFRDPASTVDSVTLAYRNENRRPIVRQLRVDYQPVMQPGRPMPQTSQPGMQPKRGQPHSPIKRLSWQAVDPDGDVLGYSIFYRREGRKDWVSLTADEPLVAPMFQWNTESIPDGRYYLKVVANDRASNLSGEELMDGLESRTLVIDNTRPAVKLQPGQNGRFTGVASDKASRISAVETSIDGGPWTSINARDGVLDSRTERFEFSLPKLPRGIHSLRVRAFDREMNIGVTSLEVEAR